MTTSRIVAWLKAKGVMMGVALWLVAVVGAMGLIADYTNTPGPAGKVPAQWPAESRLGRTGQRRVLVMFAHPHCPCTRASLGELDGLLASCPGQFEAHVVMVRPAGTETNWAATDLWRRAAEIPGVQVHEDAGGRESGLFHAETSGQTVVYDAGGRLVFAGGITVARGHAGESVGREAIAAGARGAKTGLVQAPVFGCALEGQEAGGTR